MDVLRNGICAVETREVACFAGKVVHVLPKQSAPFTQLVLLHVSLTYLFLHRYLKISSLIQHFSGLLHVNPFKYAYNSCWQVMI